MASLYKCVCEREIYLILIEHKLQENRLILFVAVPLCLEQYLTHSMMQNAYNSPPLVSE